MPKNETKISWKALLMWVPNYILCCLPLPNHLYTSFLDKFYTSEMYDLDGKPLYFVDTICMPLQLYLFNCRGWCNSIPFGWLYFIVIVQFLCDSYEYELTTIEFLLRLAYFCMNMLYFYCLAYGKHRVLLRKQSCNHPWNICRIKEHFVSIEKIRTVSSLLKTFAMHVGNLSL